MNVLVIGNGGREHAIAWKLLQSTRVNKVFCVPGNGGTASLPNCFNLAMSVTDFEGIARFAQVQGCPFVVVGPEMPLAMGITDYLSERGVPVFGPSQAGAQIEASKAWAKTLMVEAGIPTAASATFERHESQAAKDYVRRMGAPIVVKADGLAAGKGVTVAQTIEEAHAAIDEIASGRFQDAGETLVIEEFLTGQEVSVLALCDGKTVLPLLPAQDHKPIGEGDTGANTGGMGVYAPTPVLSEAGIAQVQTAILEPTLAALQARGIDYRGVLYAGLMVTQSGEIKVLEFNCRFGDPETQAVLPLLQTPLDTLLQACVDQTLGEQPPLDWHPGAAVCVVMASGGYPGDYEKGKAISGLAEAQETGALVFHAGTQLKQDQLLTSGGRVLGVTAVAESFSAAIADSYAAVHKIDFENAYFRSDIGYRIR
ncbi:phosphoribosylamine--glycine ligase [Sodalinema gerasimenkoae]|uniref:phosphoribosylamine--glycine ligase n=1 Tax=Sodalinema gerasimenkoae TaxID=2862348 RepID=UPI001357F4E6|nr:phosphoribosylamine--glycine ligase [Sodalinema gerasimenkoae]